MTTPPQIASDRSRPLSEDILSDDITQTSSRRPVIGVLVGSTRPVRIGRQLADAIADLARPEADVQILDLAQIALPFLDEPKMPSLADYVQPHTLAWKRTIDGVDAVVVVSPQYNGGYPAPLKNAIDTLYAEWRGKPILLVTYGYHGGNLAAEQLGGVLRRIRAQLVEPQVQITTSDDVRDADGHLRDAAEVVAGHADELSAGLAALRAAAGA